MSAPDPELPECESQVDVDDICGKPSRFHIERDPADPSYPGWESCDKHLGVTIAWLLEGREDVRAIVTVHWDEAER